MNKKLGLLPKVLIAMVLGVVCSFFFPEWAARIFVTFNSIFGNFLGMFLPILIIGLIVPSITELGEGAGKLLLITLVLAYFSTVLAGSFSYATCYFTYPGLLGDSLTKMSEVDMSKSLPPYFTIEMPAFINITTALVLSFVLGLTAVKIPGHALSDFFFDLRDVVIRVISSVIIPLLPIYIYGIFLKMGVEGYVWVALGMFVKIILVIFAMHITVLVAQFVIAGLVAKKNPFKALWTMLPAYLTALGTQSSAATIPVTLRCTLENGVNEDIANFTVPLCATVHMSCSMLKIVACAYAVSLSFGLPSDLGLYAGFILMLAITMVAAPGVPGGAVMASLALLSSMLGFDANMQGIVIALYIVMDSFGTAGNVTGDGAISLIVDRIAGNRKKA